MAKYAVVDLGSNSVRLVVYEVRDSWDKSRPVTSKNVKSVLNDKVMAGLASYVKNDEFTGDGICKAIDVLSTLLKEARFLDCKRIDVFATAVLRNCRNSLAAKAVIESSVGTKICLLSAQEEAHLSFVGASCDKDIEDGVMVDLGGGSLELVRICGGQDFDDVSIPQGSLSSYAQFVRFVIPQSEEAAAIKACFNGKLNAIGGISKYRAERLYAVGGSARAAAKLYATAQGMSSRPKILTPQHLNFLVNLLLDNPARFSHLAVRAVPERIHTVGPGCIILAELMRELGASTLEICKRGVREGYLLERMIV